MSKEHTGAGFVVGGLLGSASNRVGELDTAKRQAADFRSANLELQQKIDELNQVSLNLFGAQIRLKADYEGMRAIVRDLMAAIKGFDRESPMLLAKNRDAIAGEAARLSDEKNRESMFSPHMSRRSAMMAVILACTKELARLSPGHKLLSSDERFASYWVAYQEETEMRKVSPVRVAEWAQERSNYDRALLSENSEYYDQARAILDRGDVKSGPKPS